MSQSQPDARTVILRQVEAKLAQIEELGVVATVTIHCGLGDMQVVADLKLKDEPVRFERKREAVIRVTRQLR